MAIATIGLVVMLSAVVMWVGRAAGWAYDFQAYYDAAVRLIETGTPYQPGTLNGQFQPGPFGLYLYPPPFAALLTVLTPLGERVASIGWLALHMGLLPLTCALLPVKYPIRLATFGMAAVSAPFLLDLNLGNVSVIVTFTAAVAWRWLDRPTAGIAIGLAIFVRPTMAVLIGWWVLRKRWRPAIWTATAAFAIAMGTTLVFGPTVWLHYATVLSNLTDLVGVPKNADLGSAALLLGAPAWVAPMVLYGGYLAAVAAIVLSLRRDRELSFIVTVSSTLLLAPLLWDHYLIILLLPAAFLASRGRYWGLALPLLGWLPLPLLPFAAMAGMLLPFLAGPPADRPDRRVS